MKKVFKNILFVIFTFICLVLLVNKTTEAASYSAEKDEKTKKSDVVDNFDKLKCGDTITNLTEDNSLIWGYEGYADTFYYCVAHGWHLYNYKETFTVVDVLTLNGNTAYSEKHNRSYTSTAIASVLHVLHRNDGYGNDQNKSMTQKLLWSYWNAFATDIGRGNNADEKRTDPNAWILSANNDYNAEVMERAKDENGNEIPGTSEREKIDNEVASEDYSSSTNPIADTSAATYTVVTENGNQYIDVGPIKIDFSGRVSNFTIKNQNDTAFQMVQEKVKFYYYSGTTSVAFNAEDMVSGRQFYIRFLKDDVLDSTTQLKLHMETTESGKKRVKMVVLEHDVYQRLILARVSTFNETLLLDFSIDINLTGNLKIVKKDLDAIDGLKFEVRKNGNLILKNIKTGEWMYTFAESKWYELANGSDPNWKIDNETGANQYGWTNLLSYSDINIKGYLNDSACTYRVYRKTKDGMDYVLRNNRYTVTTSDGNNFLIKEVSNGNIKEWNKNDWYKNIAIGLWTMDRKNFENGQGFINTFTYNECKQYMNNPNYIVQGNAIEMVTFFNVDQFKGDHTTQEWENTYGWSDVYTAQQLGWLWSRLPGVKFTIKQGEDYLVYNSATQNFEYKNEAEWKNEGLINTFQTDLNGEIRINGLKPGEYTITEVANPLVGYAMNGSGTIKVEIGQTAVSTITNHQIINLKIKKADKDTGKALQGVGFKVYLPIKGEVGWIKKDNNGVISYVTKNEATTFMTDEKGEVTINNILTGIYDIYESRNLYRK